MPNPSELVRLDQPVHPTQYEHPGEQPYGQPTEPLLPMPYGLDEPSTYIADAAEVKQHVVVALPEGSDQVSTLYRENCELRKEVERLKRGDWTPEEVHDICHNLHGKVSAEEFAAGCAAEQRKLYGRAPDADMKEGYRKSYELMLAGMESVCESRDELKMENRELKKEVERLTVSVASADFAKAVAVCYEREACAAIANDPRRLESSTANTAAGIAAAIRARGNS